MEILDFKIAENISRVHFVENSLISFSESLQAKVSAQTPCL